MQICTNDVLQYHCFLWRKAFFKKKVVLRRDYSGFALRINSKLKHKISKFDVKVISLISMTANDDRIKEIVKHAEGFIYTVTMNATTGKMERFILN